MSHRAWTNVALFFAIATGAGAPISSIYGQAANGVMGAVQCTLWTAIWIRRKTKEDVRDRPTSN